MSAEMTMWGSIRNAIRGQPLPEVPTSPDAVLDLLSNDRRRMAIEYIARVRETDIGELSDNIAASENGKQISAISSQERKKVYVGLYQVHLPKLDEAGVLDFDKQRGVVTANELTDRYADWVSACEASSGGSQ